MHYMVTKFKLILQSLTVEGGRIFFALTFSVGFCVGTLPNGEGKLAAQNHVCKQI